MRRTTPIPDRAVDEWIDLFRDVFLRNESGIRVLSMLAARWGFFDRSVTTEERRIQRQCFMDLLICCGVFDRPGMELVALLATRKNQTTRRNNKGCPKGKAMTKANDSTPATIPLLEIWNRCIRMRTKL
jgi:hypothetical protein